MNFLIWDKNLNSSNSKYAKALVLNLDKITAISESKNIYYVYIEGHDSTFVIDESQYNDILTHMRSTDAK